MGEPVTYYEMAQDLYPERPKQNAALRFMRVAYNNSFPKQWSTNSRIRNEKGPAVVKTIYALETYRMEETR